MSPASRQIPSRHRPGTKSPGKRLREILELESESLGVLVDAIAKDVRPPSGGRVQLSPNAFRRLDKFVRRLDGLQKRIEAVEDGGRAKARLLSSIKRMKAGTVQFSLAVRIAPSPERSTAMRHARDDLRVGSQRLKQTYKGLPK